MAEKKKSKKTSKVLPPPKLARIERPIAFRNLPVKKKSLAGVLNDMEENAAIIDAMKKPEENFGFKIHGNKSWRVFESIEGPGQLLEYLQKYKSIEELSHKRIAGENLLDNLVLVRTKKNADVWKPGKQKFTKKKLEEHRKQLKAIRKRTNQQAYRQRKKGKG